MPDYTFQIHNVIYIFYVIPIELLGDISVLSRKCVRVLILLMRFWKPIYLQ